MGGSPRHLLTDGAEELDLLDPLVFFLLELLDGLLVGEDVAAHLHDLGLHVLLFQPLLDQLAHEDLLLFLQVLLVDHQLFGFLALFVQELGGSGDLGLELLNVVLDVVVVVLDLLEGLLFVVHALVVVVGLLLLGLLAALDGLAFGIQAHFLSREPQVFVLQVVLHFFYACATGDQLLALDLFVCLLFGNLFPLLLVLHFEVFFMFKLSFHGVSVGLKLVQVGAQVLDCFLEVFIALAEAVGLVALLEEVLLQVLNLLLVFLLLLVHGVQGLLDLQVRLVFLLDLLVSLRDFHGDFGYECLHALHLRDNAFPFPGLLHVDVGLEVLLLALQLVDFLPKHLSPFFDGLDVPAHVVDGVVQLSESLFVLLLLSLGFLQFKHFTLQLL